MPKWVVYKSVSIPIFAFTDLHNVSNLYILSSKLYDRFMIFIMSDDDDQVFSNNLIKFRKLRGYSQEQLAEKSTVSRRMIAYYETKVSQPAVKNVYLLAKALEISMYDLIEEKENEVTALFKDANPKTLKKIMSIIKLPRKDRLTIYNMIDALLEKNGL
jgi:transcriptional regulator with XRE-family HTH domain